MERIIHGDVLSPILAYMRLKGQHKVILESIPRDKETARFSILAYNPVFEIQFENGVLYQNGQVIDRDPLDFLYEVTHKSQHHSDLPFGGGAIGFVGYDMISLYEEIGQIPQDTIGTPDMHFFVYESYMVFDHKKEKIHVIEDALYSERSQEDLEAALRQVLEELRIPAPNEFEDLDLSPLDFKPHIAPQKFEQMVETARDLIRNGDMFQCVLSQRFSAEVTGNPFDFYRNLRVTNPSNYLYFYDFGDYQIIGASPESLVSVKNGIVTTNPIAGTRPRGATDEEDKALATDLLSDEKETAEHRMLVDLGRNDIGRISEMASVQVTKYMEVELFRYVMHLTSVVKGRLLPELTAMDALKATLPAGTVSGAPKIRAMRRIYELETEKRGLYAGAIGYLSATGDMDFAIAIRTMILKNQTAYVQAGAGVAGVHHAVLGRVGQHALHRAGLGGRGAGLRHHAGGQPGGRGGAGHGSRSGSCFRARAAGQGAGRDSPGHRHGAAGGGDGVRAPLVGGRAVSDRAGRAGRLHRGAHERAAPASRPQPDGRGPLHRRAELQRAGVHPRPGRAIQPGDGGGHVRLFGAGAVWRPGGGGHAGHLALACAQPALPRQ